MSLGITYALVIAVGNYNNPKHFPVIKFAVKDAQDFIKTLIEIGVERDDIKPLLDSNATKTAIEQEIKAITRKVTENDRIIFYFSGHGAYESRDNYLLPVDCYNDDLISTSISIHSLLGILNSSLCERNILFIDCCHSGFEPGEHTKDIDRSFLADKLIYDAKDEEYTVGFASCKSNQISITDPVLKNSVWTHFLIRALTANVEHPHKLYEQGLLYSDKLQDYLNRNTKEYVKMNTADKKDQVPVIFGNVTNKFIIADLNPIFEDRERKRVANDISLIKISIISEDGGLVKSLPGFKKGHTVPTYINSTTDGFIKGIGKSIIEDEISSLAQQIRKSLRYKLKEVEANCEYGLGAINTPDFTYAMEITQSKESPNEYVLIKKLTNFSSSEMVLKPEFNQIFSKHFDRLEFSLSKRINIEKFINAVEDMEDNESIELEYDPLDLSQCTISVKEAEYEILLTTNTMSIAAINKTSPLKLITAFKETYNAVLANPDLKMLELGL